MKQFQWQIMLIVKFFLFFFLLFPERDGVDLKDQFTWGLEKFLY